jgi:hypothetical protein
MKGQAKMFLPSDYTVYEHGKELQRIADHEALIRLAREDAPAPYTHWFSQIVSLIRRPRIELPQQQPQQAAPAPCPQTTSLRRA